VRKLSVQDVADLEAAWFELHPRDGGPLPGQIERLDADGRPVVLRIGKDLARWKNISEARFNELKAGGFVLKRGVPKPVTETVTQDSYRAMFDVLYDKIRQLEDENEKLRRERDLF
jgi:hypothetical protein